MAKLNARGRVELFRFSSVEESNGVKYRTQWAYMDDGNLLVKNTFKHPNRTWEGGDWKVKGPYARGVKKVLGDKQPTCELNVGTKENRMPVVVTIRQAARWRATYMAAQLDVVQDEGMPVGAQWLYRAGFHIRENELQLTVQERDELHSQLADRALDIQTRAGEGDGQ